MHDFTTQEVLIDQFGDPSFMRFEARQIHAPGAKELLVRQTAIGLNFVDIYFRRGEKPVSAFPFVNGFEAAGIVQEVGPDCPFTPGDRIGYPLVSGAYATWRILPADRVIALPSWLTDVQAAAILLKGLTADYLVNTLHQVTANDVVVVHAAMGGVGNLLCQWARAKGARVFGTVGCDAKRAGALALGCERALVTTDKNWAAEVLEATEGAGATIVYDGVGRDTFEGDLEVLRLRGKLFVFGSASGPPPPLDIARLNDKSILLGSPGVQHFIATRQELEQAAKRLFGAIREGSLKIPEIRTFPLDQIAAAHIALEGRRTTGSVVIIP